MKPATMLALFIALTIASPLVGCAGSGVGALFTLSDVACASQGAFNAAVIASFQTP